MKFGDDLKVKQVSSDVVSMSIIVTSSILSNSTISGHMKKLMSFRSKLIKLIMNIYINVKLTTKNNF